MNSCFETIIDCTGPEHVLDQIASYPGDKIITWDGQFQQSRQVFGAPRGNFDMRDAQITSMKRKDLVRLWKPIFKDANGVLSIVVRQFCPEKENGLPIKNIYGWAYMRGQFCKLNAVMNKECQCTDNLTGAPLDPEPAVRYC